MGLGVGVYNPFEMSLRDKGGEIGSFRANGQVTDTDGGNYEDNNTAAATFEAAVAAACLGVPVKWSYQNEHILNPVDKASSASAQRENKLLIRYHGVTSLQKFTAAIPTINLPVLVFLTEANDFVNMTTPAAIATLVTQWQAFVTNPNDGNAVIVDSLEFIGRNS